MSIKYYFRRLPSKNTQYTDSDNFRNFFHWFAESRSTQWFVIVFLRFVQVCDESIVQNLSHNCELNAFCVMAIKHTIMTSNQYTEHNLSLYLFLFIWILFTHLLFHHTDSTYVSLSALYNAKWWSMDNLSIPWDIATLPNFKKCNYEDSMSRTSENDPFHSLLYAVCTLCRNTYWIQYSE